VVIAQATIIIITISRHVCEGGDGLNLHFWEPFKWAWHGKGKEKLQ
jgi:hypothetical protein